MIFKIKNKYAVIICTGLLMSGACTDKEPGMVLSDNTVTLDYLSAEFATRADDEDITDPDTDGEGDADDGIYDVTNSGHSDAEEALLLFDDAFSSGDALYFTQLVSGVLSPFQRKEFDDYPPSISENFKSRYPDGYDNLYTYYYVAKGDPGYYETAWEDQPAGLGGYNFFAKSTDTKMEWEDIQAWGYDNNGYALFAMYFPYDNEMNMDFQVPVDQTNIDALRKSNFIAAYHSSSSPGRVRFKLYHLMCYFKLTLYIPVFKDDDVDDKGNIIKSGYPADALQSVQLLDVLTDFNINWYANRSSDSSPACSARSGGERSNIEMFIPPLTTEFYGEESGGLPPVVNIKTSNFYNPDDTEFYDPEEIDQCWKIDVSALIPQGQDFVNDPNYGTMIWSDKNFIRINMRQNIGEVPKTYIFNGNPDPVNGGHLTVGSNLTIEQGGIQHLSLYIPRHGAAAVLVGANVMDWQTAKNDQWGLNMEEPEDNNSDPDPNTNPNPDTGTED